MLTGEMAYYCICLGSLLCCSFGSQLGIHLITVSHIINQTADVLSSALCTQATFVAQRA